jgi:threonine aldolase
MIEGKEMHSKSFASDNHAGVHTRILEAISLANEGAAHAYGDDVFTERAVETFRALLGQKAEVYFVFNGTAANVLSLCAITQPYEGVFCVGDAHVNTDECGAPEAQGRKLFALPAEGGKLTSLGLQAAEVILSANNGAAPHRVRPKAISISQSTEYGTVYTCEELKQISTFARKHSLYFHVDGARIANAAATLNVSLKELIADTGVEVLSFGGTKNGILGGEAVVFLNPELAVDFALQRKQGMQLASKMRFISAQFEALLTDDLWLTNARHANRMAARLAEQVTGIPGVQITQKVQANAVFATLPRQIVPKLQQEFFFYLWNEKTCEARWMTAFNTTTQDVDAFAALLRDLVSKG